MNTKKLTRIGLVAAIYVVLTWILPMFSYGLFNLELVKF